MVESGSIQIKDDEMYNSDNELSLKKRKTSKFKRKPLNKFYRDQNSKINNEVLVNNFSHPTDNQLMEPHIESQRSKRCASMQGARGKHVQY